VIAGLRSYAALIAVIALAGALLALRLGERFPPGAAPGVALGAALAGVGAVSWIFAADRGRRHPERFMMLLGLGILGRLVVYGATLIYVALLTRIDPLWTAGSLLGFHVLFMMLEVRFALDGLKRQGS
jgi:hypothetical protein